ncbi:VOC family protein [Aequorivita marina]|uniref:VOC family protein n=1 Tax=Aequorivita marina TaxID=3073654 RepID=UPI00287403E7|nr:VOC family protein [Aequorivita sp. S2608]MDS1298130.1 VOC family protein [Aequorivita sp. S2608]
MKPINPVVWFEIYVDDIKRAQKFYEKVFQIELSELPTPESEVEMKILFFPMEMDGEGAGGALIEMEGVKAGENSTVVYFGSADCSLEEQRIEGAGGKVARAKEPIGEYGYMVLGYDTEGNKFGVHSQS